jgi:hypothetical protein
VGARSLPLGCAVGPGGVIVMARKRFNGDADGASLQAVFIELVKARRSRSAAAARWREQGARSLRGKPAALWRRLEELSRREQTLGRQLRRQARAYAPNGDGV